MMMTNSIEIHSHSNNNISWTNFTLALINVTKSIYSNKYALYCVCLQQFIQLDSISFKKWWERNAISRWVFQQQQRMMYTLMRKMVLSFKIKGGHYHSHSSLVWLFFKGYVKCKVLGILSVIVCCLNFSVKWFFPSCVIQEM